MYDTIIFDLDGTLTNTLEDIADAMNRALRLHGLPEHPTEAYRMMIGNGARKLAERAVGEHREQMETVLADYQAYYETHTQVKTKPYPGIPETLKALQAAGVNLCVLSNKPHADTMNVVTSFFPEIEWAMIRGQMPGVPVKPDPAGAQAMVDALCVQPGHCLYAGDSGVDMETARNAGMVPVGVLWGYRDAQELTENGALKLVERPEELVVLALGDD